MAAARAETHSAAADTDTDTAPADTDTETRYVQNRKPGSGSDLSL